MQVMVVECEDCGESPLDASQVSVFHIDGEYTATSLCQYCERPIVSNIPVTFARDLFIEGSNLLDWIEN